MRIGCVGAGYFAQFQLRAWHRMPEAHLVGVADQDPARLAALDLPHVAHHPGIASLLADHDLDILDIATPPATHASLIRQALGRVPVIICQKPFCASLAEAEAMVAEAGDTILIVHENFRFQPWYREIRRLLNTGRLGRVLQARFALRPGDGQGEEAYLDRQPYFRDMPRFLIRETGIHFIDVFRYLLGEPEAVYADLRRVNPVIAGEDAGIVIFDLADGGRAVFDGNRNLDHAAENTRMTLGEMEIEGTDATLRLTGDGAIHIRARNGASWQRHPHTFDDIDFGGNCVEAFQAHVLAGLSGKAMLETRATEYLTNLRLEALIYASAQQGAKLPLPHR
ncbi:MAG: Gfo/Idh/MocA family oxidoreductase [Pseudomonadota bacterium]